MSVDRWARVERLYHDALEQPPGRRDAFLDEACEGDRALRDEVGSLLACDSAAGGFLQQPAIEAAHVFAADHARLIGQEIGGYRITALLGCGGMGEVYQARDVRLERDIAVKVVAEGLDGDAAYVHRFEEEARSASGLNHPNIVTIYGVGEQDGVAFIAMELVLGTTLRQVLDAGPMPLATAWDLALQLAEALGAAHAAGIVHRDLKPDNIMVTPNGLLKVLDFGIARRERAGAAVSGAGAMAEMQTGLTSNGAIIGTAGYMSPEQAAGRPADRASDQFSFATILYEMLTARRAFARATPRDTISAIINDEPAPIDQFNAAVPAALRQVLARAFRKVPGERYADTGELAVALRRGRDQWQRAQAGGVTRRQAVAAAAAAAVTVVSGGAIWATAFRDRGIRSLAVLPFVNATRDPAADYLADGLTEGLIQRLSLPSLRVVARSTMFHFRARAVEAAKVGRQLRVDAVLTGAVERAEGGLRIQAALLELATNRTLWTRTYDRGTGDALLLQEDIVRGVLDEGIRFRPTDADRQALARPATADAAAYDLYLRGLSIFRRDTEADYRSSQALLRQAVARDPTFADGHAALAATYSVLAIDGYMRPNEAWAGSVSSAQRAIALDRDVPTAHAELGAFFFFFSRDWTLAERAWETARHARGGRYEPDFLMGYALERWATGRPQGALALARQARELDPVGPGWALREADFLLANQNLSEASRVYELLTRELPDDPRAHFGLAEVRRRQGRFDEAIACLGTGHAAGGNPALQSIIASARGEAGLRRVERITAQLQLEDLRKRQADGRYVSPLDFARAHAQLGDTARAFEFFPAAFAERSPGLVFLNVDRAWDEVRGEPQFRAAVDEIRLSS